MTQYDDAIEITMAGIGPTGLQGPPGLGFAANVMAPPYNAVGNNIADDTAAIQTAINDRLAVYFPYTVTGYKFGAVTLRSGSHLIGETRGNGGASSPNTSTRLNSYVSGVSTPFAALYLPAGAAGYGDGVCVENLMVQGNAVAQVDYTWLGYPSYGFYGGSQVGGLILRNAVIAGFNINIALLAPRTCVLDSVLCNGSVNANLFIGGGADGVEIRASEFIVVNQAAHAHPSSLLKNVHIATLAGLYPANVQFRDVVIDEVARGGQATAPTSLLIDRADDLLIDGLNLYVPINGNSYSPNGGGVGIKIGALSKRVRVKNTRVTPYAMDANHVPLNTITIDATATGCSLSDVTTVANGGGDISDLATDTDWRNVNGVSHNTSLTTALAGKQATIPPNTYAASRNLGTGIYVPLGWGKWWKVARTAAGTTPAVVACVGDSITRGYFAGTLLENGWVGQVKASLQALYGDGGSGFKGVVDTAIVSAVMSNYVAEQVVLGSAGWAMAGGVSDGPGLTDVYNATAGATATFPGVRGTSIRVFMFQATTGSTVSISVDGATAVNNTTVGAAGIKVVTISGLSTGTHSVVVTNTGGGTVYLNMLGVCGEKATGVRVDNYGRQGGISTNLNPGSVTYGHPGDWNGGPLNPADLVIYGYGVNDANATNNTAADTYLVNLQAYLARVRSGTAGGKRGKVDIIVLIPHLGVWGPTKLYSDYVARVRTLAETYGAAVIDIWAIGMNSWELWSDLGYWSDGTSSNTAGSDQVHPRTTGHTAIATVVTDLLTTV